MLQDPTTKPKPEYSRYYRKVCSVHDFDDFPLSPRYTFLVPIADK